MLGGARVTWGDLQVPAFINRGATEGLSEVGGRTLAVCFYVIHYWTSIRRKALFSIQRDTGKLSGCDSQLIRG